MPILFTSPKSAHTAGQNAVAKGRAKSYVVTPYRQRNADRSVDQGFAVILKGIRSNA